MNAIDWDALDRYFAGEGAEVRGDSKVIESVREIWDAAGVMPVASRPDVDGAWRSVLAKLDDHGAKIGAPRTSSGILRFPGTSNRRWWPGALAMAAALVVAAVALRSVMDSREAARQAAIPVPQPREYATKRAQRAEVNLSDGTRVMLNVDSRLRVAVNYGKGARDVELEGEAYFDVVHDFTRPFRVRTAAGVAEDAGTAFVVSQYPEQKGMRVAVRSGRVIVNRATTLEPRDVASVDAAGQVSVRHGVDVERDLAWTKGQLAFERLPLREVMPRLSRWFDAEIVLGDSALGELRYTASFRHEPVGQVLELLAASLNARVERAGESRYVLYSKK